MANNTRRRAQDFSGLLRTIGSDTQSGEIDEIESTHRRSSILAGRCIGTGSASSETSFHSAQTNIASSTEPSISETHCSANNLDENISAASYSPTSSTEEFSNEGTSYLTSDSSSKEISAGKNILQPSEFQPSYMTFIKKLAEEMGCPETFPTPKSDQLITRMSETFTRNPEDFKKKLLTIMEVAELTDEVCLENDRVENSAIEIDLMVQKFVECCKYIHDESMPSIMMTSPINLDANQDENQLEKIAEESLEISARAINFSTPKQHSPGKLRKIYRKTPVHSSAIASPLYMAAMKRNATPKTPGTPKGQDSFIMWEKYCEENTTPSNENSQRKITNSSPTIVLAEKEKILMKCQEQYESLNDSVLVIEPTQEVNKGMVSSDLETFDSHAHFSHSSGADYGTAHSLSSSILDDEDDLTRTIMLEVAKRRQRCHETERTIREIDAASSSSDSSLQGSGKMLELFQFINQFDEYHCYLKEHKGTIKNATRRLSQKFVNSGIGARSKVDVCKTPRKRLNNPTTSTKKQKTPGWQTVKSTKAVTPRGRPSETQLRLTTNKQIYSKSPVLSTHGSTPYRVNSSTGSNSNLKQSNISSISSSISKLNERISRPTQKLSSPCRSRYQSISPIGTLSVNSNKTPAGYISPELMRMATKTPKEKSISTNLKKSFLPLRGETTPSNTSSVPTVIITPAPSTGDLTKILKSSTKTNSSPSTPVSSAKNTQQIQIQRRFFITPNKLNPSGHVIGAGPRKPRTYFTGYSDVDGYTAVKSPVAAYIRGTDKQLVEKVRGKSNMFTPKSKGDDAGTRVKI